MAYTSVATNGVVNGVIGSDFGTPLLSAAANGGFKDVDFLAYDVTQTGLLDLTASSPDNSMSPVLGLWVYDSVANDVIKVADTTGSAAAIDYAVTAGQSLYISVTGQGNQGFNWFAVASGSGGDVGQIPPDGQDPADVPTCGC